MGLENFQKTLNKGVTLVDFNAAWCALCKAQTPAIKKLITLYQRSSCDY